MQWRGVRKPGSYAVAALLCALVSCRVVSVPPQVAAVEEGEADLAVGNPARALVHFEQALRLEPESWQAQRGIALAQLELGQPREARVRFEALAHPETGPFPPDLMASACRALWAGLEADLAAGRSAEAVAIAETGRLAASCTGPRLSQLQRKARFGEATRLRAAGDDEASLRQLAEILKRHPGDPAATLASVDLLVQAGRRPAALRLLSEALARHPADPDLVQIAVDLLLLP